MISGLCCLPSILGVFPGPVGPGFLVFLICSVGKAFFLLAGRGLEPTSPLQPGVGVAPPRAVSNHTAASSSGMNCHSSAVRTMAWISQPLLPLHGREQSKLNLSDPVSGKKSFNSSREEATGNKNLVVCIEPLLFSKTNTKEVCGEPETAICSTVVHERIHYPGDAPPVGVAEQEAMTNYWYRPENPGTGFPQAPDSSCT